eukprot:5168897-Pyramimonas_sp.AAC.1
MSAYAQVLPGVEGRRFHVQRGIRQRGLSSPVLFNLRSTASGNAEGSAPRWDRNSQERVSRTCPSPTK